MKKLLYAGILLVSFASTQMHAWVHRVINDTDYKVWVEVHYHGASQILKSCRPDKLFIDAKQEATVDAKSCSIRTIVGHVQEANKKISLKAYSPPAGYVGNGTFWITESSNGDYSIERSNTLSLRHSLTNESDKTIDVFMWLHGESMLGTNAENCLKNPLTSCCRRERRDLKPGERVEWTTGGCQIKSIRVEDVGTDHRVTVNIRNASVNELKKVGVVVAGVLVVAGAVAATVVTGGVAGKLIGAGAAAAGAAGAAVGVGGTVATVGVGVGFTALAKKVFANVEHELVAYGSTGWMYDGTIIGPVNGVTIYKK